LTTLADKIRKNLKEKEIEPNEQKISRAQLMKEVNIARRLKNRPALRKAHVD